jgi:DNA-3-methyladenine glycosylase I
MSAPREAAGCVVGDDGRARCWWPGRDPLYVAYHDLEWGRPVDDDALLFEHLCLEAFQAGLSWLIVLRKRAAFRRAFHGFDPAHVAAMGPADVERLMGDPSIVRNRKKIEAVLHNAGRCLALQAEAGSLAAFLWRYEAPALPAPTSRADLPATSPESHALSKALKARGWRFAGPTGTYACMQAVGIVNDHLPGCSVRADCERARAGFARPS